MSFKKTSLKLATNYLVNNSFFTLGSLCFRQLIGMAIGSEKSPFMAKRNSVLLWKEVQKQPLLCNFIEITLWHGCSPLHLLHIFRTPFLKNTSEWLLLEVASSDEKMTPAKGSYILKYISVHRRPMHV